MTGPRPGNREHCGHTGNRPIGRSIDPVSPPRHSGNLAAIVMRDEIDEFLRRCGKRWSESSKLWIVDHCSRPARIAFKSIFPSKHHDILLQDSIETGTNPRWHAETQITTCNDALFSSDALQQLSLRCLRFVIGLRRITNSGQLIHQIAHDILR